MLSSRASEGVILEENTDEIGGSDSSAKYTDMDGKVETAIVAESYVNMAPVVQRSQVLSSSLEEAKFVHKPPNVCSPNHSSPRSDIQFPECATDHVTKIVPDEDTHQERPTRAYSIGSRSEHNRMFKQHMGGGGRIIDGGGGGGGGGSGFGNNLNDADHVRVRAFSVGSRAKIPRCDLQRGVLSPKLMLEQQQLQQLQLHCHSNSSSNNNISADASQLSSSSSSASTTVAAYNHLMNIYGSGRDKKSTSAPMLIHKSQTSVDRMSDLMEIDFSIKPSSNSTNSRINLTANKTSYSKSIPSSASTTTIIPTTTSNDNIIAAAATTTTTTTLVTSSSNNQLKQPKQQQQQQQQKQQTVSTTDNGYLEMKPVGSQTIYAKPTTTTKKQQQQQQTKKQQRNEHIAKQQRPKTMLLSSTSTSASTPSSVVAPEKSNINTKTTAAETTKTTTTTANTATNVTNNIKTTTVLSSNKFNQELLEQTNANLTARQTTDNDNNSQVVLEDNNKQSQQQQQHETSPDKCYNLISQLASTTTTTTSSTTQQQQQQECKLNKNIADDYIHIEQKFDAYMTLNANPNSNNYGEQSKPNTIATKLLHDNDNKPVLLHALSHDEQQHKTVTAMQKGNRKVATVQHHHDNDTGYEILQIKSDSSLQAHKALNNRPAATKKDNNNKLPALQQSAQQITRPRSTNSSALITSASDNSTLYSSSSTSCLHPSSTAPLTANTANNITTTTTATATTASISCTKADLSVGTIAQPSSRPSSVNLECQLYYAKLDWPQCSKPPKTEVLCSDSGGGGGGVGGVLSAVLPAAPNVYAKIDFDHSDSSSSSSKNI